MIWPIFMARPNEKRDTGKGRNIGPEMEIKSSVSIELLNAAVKTLKINT